ncbi:rhodanese-like domain-containing protein [Humidisolicoccus flavus]|uniref:rhodanese-like domain-containing protein n=1 Tax=Humidisolicoccus flavus TaxID=3111414 RepID=UPI003255381B
MNTTSISVDDLASIDQPVVIDVREDDEFAGGHVPGAIPMPMSRFLDFESELPDGPLYVICHSGARSDRVCEYLRSKDLEAINVEGGTLAWVQSGREVTVPDAG